MIDINKHEFEQYMAHRIRRQGYGYFVYFRASTVWPEYLVAQIPELGNGHMMHVRYLINTYAEAAWSWKPYEYI